jgi:hypothetical protein
MSGGLDHDHYHRCDPIDIIHQGSTRDLVIGGIGQVQDVRPRVRHRCPGDVRPVRAAQLAARHLPSGDEPRRVRWEAARSGEGPAMYWYGWTMLSILVGFILGLLATLLPEWLVKKVPLALVWLLPILAFIPLAYSLMPFWTK